MWRLKSIIDKHFCDIIYKIDKSTQEKIVIYKRNNETESIEEINKLRKRQIDQINEIMQLNLSNLFHLNKEFVAKSSDRKNSLDLNENIKEQIILVDCVLIKDHVLLNGFELWVISWFFNEKHLDLLG
jgi:hypothetical protein